MCVCVRERERERKREKERERKRESVRERESERNKERERESVHLCMQRVRRCTQVKGTKRMQTQLAYTKMSPSDTNRYCCMRMLADRAL